MTEFEITVNGHTETIHAKYVGGGRYRVEQRKTRNFAAVHYIETVFSDGGASAYKIKAFYPSSPYTLTQNIKQQIKLIR